MPVPGQCRPARRCQRCPGPRPRPVTEGLTKGIRFAWLGRWRPRSAVRWRRFATATGGAFPPAPHGGLRGDCQSASRSGGARSAARRARLRRPAAPSAGGDDVSEFLPKGSVRVHHQVHVCLLHPVEQGVWAKRAGLWRLCRLSGGRGNSLAGMHQWPDQPARTGEQDGWRDIYGEGRRQEMSVGDTGPQIGLGGVKQ
jgi:hypothetical protein